MNNILVTGGLGYIGSHVVVELMDSGYNPIIIDDLHNSDISVLDGIEEITKKRPAFYQGKFFDTKLLNLIHEEHSLDGIIHIAAYKYVDESVEKPLMYYANNVSGFVSLLEFTVKNNINNFVFSSSAAVYGNPPNEIVTEETPCRPETPYGWSKYMDEIILKDTCNSGANLQGLALRYFNVVGSHGSNKIGELPKVKPQNLLPLIVKAADGQTLSITVFGDDYPTPDGTCLRDYIHVVDLAKAHLAAIQRLSAARDSGYQTFNVGTGKPTSVLELIETFQKVNEVKISHKIGSRRLGDPVASYANVEKIERELGWKSEKSIKDACRDAWRWHQSIS